MREVITKQELFKIMERFYADDENKLSDKLFGELAGVHPLHLRDIFIYKKYPLTENVQRRVSRAYNAWKNGEVAIMQNRDRTKYIEYRKVNKPVLVRSTGLQVVDGQIKVKVGIKNPLDYSGETLDEQLKRG